MKLKLPTRRRALRWIVVLILVVIALLYLVVPAVFGVYVVFPYKESVGAPPEGFSEVSLTAEDGVRLAAWYAPPANGVAILLLHGAGGSREGVRGHAAMLREHGYGVLALDLRGHGESGGRTNRFGWRGTRDVRAAAAYLQEQPEVTAVGGLGLSLGGEVLLGAASGVPALRAIVADGATQRSLDELRALPSERPLLRNFTARVMFATVQLLSGDDPPSPPLLASMTQAEGTAFLLIAAGSDAQEVDFNTLFAETVGARATLWVAPDASHTGAFKRYPDEYERRVTGFFDAVLR